jgi:hypothetical protein
LAAQRAGPAALVVLLLILAGWLALGVVLRRRSGFR